MTQPAYVRVPVVGKSKKYPPDPFAADRRREKKRAKKLRRLGKVYIPKRTWE